MIRSNWSLILTPMLSLLLLFVSACQSQLSTNTPVPNLEQLPPTEAASAPSTDSAAADEMDSGAETFAPAEAAAPLETQTLGQNNEVEVEPAPTPSAESSQDELVEGVPPTEEPQPTAAVVINGVYEGTYFRGWESAPVTMMDYSDFL